LVELLVTLAILAILAAVALPVYTEHVRKGRRSDAVAALSLVQQSQERWRANSASYADKLETLGFNSTSSAKGYYQLSLSDVSAGGYTATASAISDKAQAADSKCAQMWVTLSSGTLNYGSTQAGCWAQ
jgi:type IV pilus assembly protein PilE